MRPPHNYRGSVARTEQCVAPTANLPSRTHTLSFTHSKLLTSISAQSNGIVRSLTVGATTVFPIATYTHKLWPLAKCSKTKRQQKQEENFLAFPPRFDGALFFAASDRTNTCRSSIGSVCCDGACASVISHQRHLCLLPVQQLCVASPWQR